jgi:hypothetical protein
LHVTSIFQTLIYRISNLKLCALVLIMDIVVYHEYNIGKQNVHSVYRQNMCSRIQNQKFNYILIALCFFFSKNTNVKNYLMKLSSILHSILHYKKYE